MVGCRPESAVHYWVQKVDLRPAAGKQPYHAAVDQKVIQLNDDKYWLYATVVPEMNEFLGVSLFPSYTQHDVKDAVFLIDDVPELQVILRQLGFDYRVVRHGKRNKIERLFREIERRISSFSNTLSHTAQYTAESWLQAFVSWWDK